MGAILSKQTPRDLAMKTKASVTKLKLRQRTTAVMHHLGEKVAHAFESPYRFLRSVLIATGLVVWLILLIASATIYGFFHSLPDMSQATFGGVRAVAQKRVKGRLKETKRQHKWVSIKEMSRELIYSIVASEDSTFFEHSGLNYEAILDSLAENLKKGEPAYGASTISQQVAKNIYFSDEKTLIRKLKEAFVTRDLEDKFSKNEILELYLNIAEFGPELFGIEAAAKQFFGKRPLDLNAAEGAFLGLMLPSPRRNYFSIWQNRNLTRNKRQRLQRVLRDMLYEELITEKQYVAYLRYDFFARARRAVAGK